LLRLTRLLPSQSLNDSACEAIIDGNDRSIARTSLTKFGVIDER
jgi:hypothetical protein